MIVRVCGPNLSDQRAGTFHVHADGCPRLTKYGPGRRYGGDANGEEEMQLDALTQAEVCHNVYSDQISEAMPPVTYDKEADREQAKIINDYLSDFYFAPCTRELR